MTDFCWPILLADGIGQLYRSSDISLRWTESLLRTAEDHGRWANGGCSM